MRSHKQSATKLSCPMERGSAERLFLAGCISLAFLMILYGSLSVSHEQQYVFLAESFFKGKLYFVSMPEHWHDTAFYAGRHYWPLGPLPALILMPAVFVWRLTGGNFYQGYASLPISLLTGWLCFRLARRCGRSPEESAWLTLSFCSSSYLGIAMISMSWSLAHVVAVALLFMTLHEWLGRRRWWLIGFLLGLTMTARLPCGLNLALFAGAALVCQRDRQAKPLARLTAGFAIPLFLLAAYNFARFGSFLEVGYAYQPRASNDFDAVGFANILPHLRVFLLGMPIPSETAPFFTTDPVGMSVLLLSPWLLYLGTVKMDWLNGFALTSCVFVLLAVLAWRSTGQLQVGYRFSLDFLPIVLFVLARSGFSDKSMCSGFKVLTSVGFLLTLYFTVRFIGSIPQG